MASEQSNRSESFLSRWSRRKLAAAREAPSGASADSAGAADAAPAVIASVTSPPTSPAPPAAAAAASLPPVESLTFESDFSAFLAPGVEPDVQRAALRKLLRDPRFNAMDGLDVYIDDYTKPSPLDPAVARTLWHAQALFAQTAPAGTKEPAATQAAHAEPLAIEAAQAGPAVDDAPRIPPASHAVERDGVLPAAGVPARTSTDPATPAREEEPPAA